MLLNIVNRNTVMTQEQLWNGYCPECMLAGKRARMKLNMNDFYECEKSGLQLAITVPGSRAVILNARGHKKFSPAAIYAESIDNGELLFLQTKDKFPYCGDEPISSNEEMKNYIDHIKKN
jgi:hypothetical protein